jgi:hydrogenase maturation factor
MSAGPRCNAPAIQHCATCADEALAMTVLRLDERRGLALCASERGERATVEIALLEQVALGERVLVHAGVAIASLPAAADAAREVGHAGGPAR